MLRRSRDGAAASECGPGARAVTVVYGRWSGRWAGLHAPIHLVEHVAKRFRVHRDGQVLHAIRTLPGARTRERRSHASGAAHSTAAGPFETVPAGDRGTQSVAHAAPRDCSRERHRGRPRRASRTACLSRMCAAPKRARVSVTLRLAARSSTRRRCAQVRPPGSYRATLPIRHCPIAIWPATVRCADTRADPPSVAARTIHRRHRGEHDGRRGAGPERCHAHCP